MKLQSKIFQLVTLTIVSVAAVAFFTFNFYLEKSSELIFVSLFEKSAIQASNNVQKFLFEKVNNIVQLSKDVKDENRIANVLLEARNIYDNFESIEYLDSKFVILSQTSRVGIGEISENKDLAEKVLTSRFARADFVTSKKFGRSHFRVCVPVFSQKQLLGFLIGLVPLEKISDFFSTYNADYGNMIKPNVYMVRQDGSLIYKNHNGAHFDLYKDAIQKIGEEEESSTRFGEEYVFVSRSLLHDAAQIEDWFLVVNFSYADLDYPIHMFRNISIVLLLLSIFVIFILIRGMTINVLSPLEDINNKFNKLAVGEFEEIKLKSVAVLEFKNLISGYNLMIERLQHSVIELNQRSKLEALGQMAASIAHEVNNPLAIIKGHAEKLMIILGSKPNPQFLHSVQTINQTVDRIVSIVNSLRIFSRDGSKETFEVIEIKKIINLTLDLCAEKLRMSNVDLQLYLPEEPLNLECRLVQVSQVLINLITNAFDAIKTESEKWIKLEVQSLPGSVQFRITNSGKKIEKEVLDKIFVPFFTTKPVAEGTGLGLSLSKGIAESHNGRLFVDLDQNFTCFVLELPLSQPIESDVK